MKVLIFSLTYHPFIGGAEVAVKEITDRITDILFDMITVNLDGKQKAEEKIGNVNVYRIGNSKKSKYFFPLQAFKFAEKLHAQNSYDAVWSIMANQAGLAALFFKKKNPKIPFLLTLQEGDSEFDIWLRTFYIRPLYKSIYRRADYIQAISHFLADRARSLGAKCAVEVVPNGVDLERIRNQESGIRNDKEKNIITTSRLEKKNGIDILIKAYKLLVIHYSLPITLKILGTGRLEGELKKLSKDLQIADRIEFLGHIHPCEIYSYLQKADIFVRPSRSEGLGSSFLEAMACGIPVIGTQVGGIPDFLKDGETGLFCKVDDPKDLAEKIELLLADENLYKKISYNGRQLAIEKYQWFRIASRMKNIFNEITKKLQTL